MKQIITLSVIAVLFAVDAISQTTNYLSKFSTPPSLVNSLLFDNGTGLAIGTTNTNGHKLRIAGGTISLDNNMAIFMNDGLGNDINALWIDNTGLTNINASYLNGNGAIRFRVGGADRMRILYNGNIGVGKTNPSYRLDVAGPVNATQYLVNGVPLSTSAQWQISGSNIYYNSGNVGVGTSTPGAKLEVNGDVRFAQGYIRMGYNGYNSIIDDWSPNTGLLINWNSRKDVTIGAKLSVCGEVKCKKIRVESGWCDFVFEDNYKLMSLQEVEKYYTQNKRLPNYLPEKAIKADGLDLGDITVLHQQSIEEIYIYLVELKKENEFLKNQFQEIKKVLMGSKR